MAVKISTAKEFARTAQGCHPGYFTLRTKRRQTGAPVCNRLWANRRVKPAASQRSVPVSVKYPGQGA